MIGNQNVALEPSAVVESDPDVLWRLLMDDGRGPYDYCKRGLSHCQDQQCDCVDSARYRALYVLARERHGLSLGLLPEQLILFVAACTIGGGAIGAAAVVLWRWLHG